MFSLYNLLKEIKYRKFNLIERVVIMKKKEFVLEGLHCMGCATKIENALNKVEGISSANINFVNQNLTVEISNHERIEDMSSLIINLVKKLEPHAKIIEKQDKKSVKKEILLEGLCCGNCAAKIEREAKNIEGVANSTVDFISTKLILEIDSMEKKNEIMESVREIVKRIEPDVQVIEIEKNINNKNTIAASKNEESNKNDLIKFVLGTTIFIIATALKFSNTIELLLYSISYIIIGGNTVLRAFNNIIKGEVFDENFLMSVATIGAFAIGQYPEGVAVMLFYQIGEIFQGIAVKRSRKSISDLMDIRPDFANLQTEAGIIKVNPEEINIGDIIVVKPGEKVPLDGKIIEGFSALDTSALTGESLPREVQKEDRVLSGSINKQGLLTIKVEKIFSDSTVSKILELVENASAQKAPTEKFITKFSRYYTPVVVFSAIAIAVIPPLIIQGATFSEWIYRALSFLVVSCPCALVVSIPLGFFGGIGGASRKGILVKGGNYLEALNNVEIVIFDKTGTLTKGVFKVTDIVTKTDLSKENLLMYVAHAESYSNHPIANSILIAYGKEIVKDKIKNYEEISGYGVRAFFDDKEILAGNSKFMTKENIISENVDAIGTIVHIALDKKYAGYIVISDEVKEDAKKAIKLLKDIGVKKTIMLTGDNSLVANKIAKELEIDEVFSELLPNQKVEKLEKISETKALKGKVVFVGDGINDAPVLARADIGIAMGGIGSDAAIEAADIVIMTDEPSKIATAIQVAKKTRKIVMQNIVFSLGVKAILLVLVTIGVGTMWEAVFGDVGVTLIAVLNSMRSIGKK